MVEFIPCTKDEHSYSPSEGVTSKHIWSALKDSIIANFGDSGWGAVASSLTGTEQLMKHVVFEADQVMLLVKYFSPMTNLSIIRVARDHHRIAWGAVTLLRSIQGKPYLPNVIHVSGTPSPEFNLWHPYNYVPLGTIKHTQLSAISHNRETVARIRAQSKLPGKIVLNKEAQIRVNRITLSALYRSTVDDYLERSTKEIEALQD